MSNLPFPTLPEPLELLRLERIGPVLHVRLSRPAKRNAMNDSLVRELEAVFTRVPADVQAILVSGEGEHFCAGLDLSELTERNTFQAVLHSRMWHAVMDRIQNAPAPVVAALHGAVVGGGLELASACHVRVADESTYYALPEGQRGIFVGGGAASRVPRLIGVARMADMMLTGRVLDAQEGLQLGLSTYLVPKGESVTRGLALAQRIATNTPLSNFAVTQALPRIAEMPPGEGLFLESLMAAVASSDDAAKLRLQDFLAGRAAKVRKE